MICLRFPQMLHQEIQPQLGSNTEMQPLIRLLTIHVTAPIDKNGILLMSITQKKNALCCFNKSCDGLGIKKNNEDRRMTTPMSHADSYTKKSKTAILILSEIV